KSTMITERGSLPGARDTTTSTCALSPDEEGRRGSDWAGRLRRNLGIGVAMEAPQRCARPSPTSCVLRSKVPPGEMLREDFLPEHSLTDAGLADTAGVSRQSVNELLRE